MPDAKQQRPASLYPHIILDVPPGIYEYKTLDILAQAGYSKTLARELTHRWLIWQPL